MAGYEPLETRLTRYEHVHLDKFADQPDAGRSGGAASAYSGGQQPVSSSWLTWHVRLPSHIALLTMVCIVIYEILVAVSMGVRVLRFVMVQWLAWVLLAVNVALLLILGGIVLYHRVDCTQWRLRRMAQTSNEAKTFDE